jgi:hypothetical protein
LLGGKAHDERHRRKRLRHFCHHERRDCHALQPPLSGGSYTGGSARDNQHKKITAYRDLNQSEIDGMSSIKVLKADAGKLFK